MASLVNKMTLKMYQTEPKLKRLLRNSVEVYHGDLDPDHDYSLGTVTFGQTEMSKIIDSLFSSKQT